jgi:hypothetical protein
MKRTSLLVVTIIFVVSASAFSQGAEIYDRNYQGPMNIYGQPVLTVPEGQQSAGVQNQQFPGVLPMISDGVSGIGGYLWSYMPAPLRGAQSPYYVPPDSGAVSQQFVPGTR